MQLGVLVCGTGIGMAIAANRHPAIRCAVAHDVTSARLSRAHNNANVLALGARLIGEAVALDCLHAFIATGFDGGRHAARVAKLSLGGKGRRMNEQTSRDQPAAVFRRPAGRDRPRARRRHRRPSWRASRTASS